MKQRGLGDTIKIITNALGFKTCDRCRERQNYFNTILPYGNYNKVSESDTIMIEGAIKEPTKFNCKLVNEWRKNYDGVWTDSCFCTLSQRMAFIRDFSNFWATIK